MEQIVVGKLVATHGIAGQLILSHALGQPSALPGVKAIMVRLGKTSAIPYFLQAAKARSTTETLVTLEEITTKEKARILLNKAVLLQKDDFEKVVAKTSPLGLVGYQVVANGNALGTVAGVMEQPGQIIAAVMVGDIEVLLPLHEKTIQSVDRKRKELHLDLPDGLLDIYLQ